MADASTRDRIASMRLLVWIFLVAFPLTALAAPWEDLLNDIEMFEKVVDDDAADTVSDQIQANLDDSEELFPHEEGVEPAKDSSISLSETHVTIKVNGVPVILGDVPHFEWFAIFVKDVADRNLISGYRDEQGFPTGEFGPADNVTIEQLAKMAIQAAAVDTYLCTDDLKNETADGRWSEDFIRCAENEAWALYSDGSVDVTRPATREEVVVTVLQAFGARIAPRSGTVFDDVSTSVRYGAAIETAANNGIVSGYTDERGNPTGLFGPKDAVNRAETAKIFSLAFAVYGN